MWLYVGYAPGCSEFIPLTYGPVQNEDTDLPEYKVNCKYIWF